MAFFTGKRDYGFTENGRWIEMFISYPFAVEINKK
jgi:hypothetical protein